MSKKRNCLGHRLLNAYRDDDRLHDVLAPCLFAAGEYEEAVVACRQHWQVALKERDFFREKGYHKREGNDHSQPVHFFHPSTWL
jgi:hypothetical protein